MQQLQATATRAGILYISEGRQWHNMVQSWLQRVAKPYAEKAKWKVSHGKRHRPFDALGWRCNDHAKNAIIATIN
jgi:hypothetical protein